MHATAYNNVPEIEPDGCLRLAFGVAAALFGFGVATGAFGYWLVTG